MFFVFTLAADSWPQFNRTLSSFDSLALARLRSEFCIAFFSVNSLITAYFS